MKAGEARGLGERAQAMIDALAAISDEPERLTRHYLTPAHRQAADLVADWMKRAGLDVRMDAAATVRGFMPAGRAGPCSAKRLLVGSHIDTVIDGGRFDGVLGVVAGIVAVEELRARGVALPFGLEVLAFGDEEGGRFATTFLSSSAIAGSLDPAALDLADQQGVTVREALSRFGCDPDALEDEAYLAADVVGFLEVHIEQGPVLERAGEPLGVVSAIAGQARYRLTVRGEAGHAGTVPMAARRDALAAAAEMITTIEDVAREGLEHSLVATVGAIRVAPGAANVIAGAAEFSLDVRAANDAARGRAVAEIRDRVGAIAARRHVTIAIETAHEKVVAAPAAWLQGAIGRAIHDLTGREPPTLMSGAGHDGQAMIQLTDIGMIFVRCRKGISHSPLEFVEVEDIARAVEALIGTITAIAGAVGR